LGAAGEFSRKPRLSDAWLTTEQDGGSLPRSSAAQGGLENRHLSVTADERHSSRG
jgi:hypothetical protein